MLTLDLAIVTHRQEGIRRVAAMRLPVMEGVRYVVSWQSHEGAPVPRELMRDDVEIHRFDGRGISANRNNALAHCRADILLFADDDISISPEGLAGVRRVYEENPEVDVATFRSEYGDMRRFPAAETDLTHGFPKGYSVSSIELSLRRATAGALRCCPELGIGSGRFLGGEDEVFLLTAIRRGLNCRFFPVTVCAHPGESTGTKRDLSDGNIRAAGVVIALSYPRTAFLRVPLKAWRLARGGRATLGRALRLTAAGALAASSLRRRNREFLW